MIWGKLFLENFFLDGGLLGPASNLRAKDRSKPRQHKKAVGADLPWFPLFTHRIRPRHTFWSTTRRSHQLTFTMPRVARLCGAQKTPEPRFLISNFRVLLVHFGRLFLLILIYSEYCSLRSHTFYPDAAIKWPGRKGLPPISRWGSIPNLMRSLFSPFFSIMNKKLQSTRRLQHNCQEARRTTRYAFGRNWACHDRD